MTSRYADDFLEAQADLKVLMEEREQLEVSIAKQIRKVAALGELCCDADQGNSSVVDLGGLSEAIRTALRGSRKEWMNLSDVKQGLEEVGFPVRDYKAITAAISTSLKRMVNAGDVARQQLGGSDSEYKWVGRLPLSDLMKRKPVEAEPGQSLIRGAASSNPRLYQKKEV